jgi:hypothetical protein
MSNLREFTPEAIQPRRTERDIQMLILRDRRLQCRLPREEHLGYHSKGAG